jgi:hypothetical protein
MRWIHWLVGVAMAILVLGSICSSAFAQDTGIQGIQSMKLMAPGVGWAASSNQLFWTSDGGKTWKDVTPPTSPGTGISAVFFLDTSTGWALLSRQADPDEEREFDFAATTNAGTSWTVTSLQVPDPSPHGSGLSGTAFVDFADVSHGWINIRVNQGSGPTHSWGVLLTTADGGKSWKRLKLPPAANSMLFRSPEDGWLAEDGDLYRTSDGGNTWQQISLQAPPAMKSARVEGDYNLPVFQDATHGSMLAGYFAVDSSGFAVDGSQVTVLFSTIDGGNTWGVSQALPPGYGRGNLPVIGGTVVAAQISPKHLLTLTRFGAVNSRVQTDLTSLAGNADSVRALGVLDENRIWLLAYASVPNQRVYTELLSSSDGGVSWAKITPPNIKW